jgi:hypothetical protein
MRLACLARRGESRGIAAGAVFGLACWLRPEGTLALAVVVVVLVVGLVREGKGLRAFSDATKVLGAAIAVYAPWELFRVVYYGSYVPNTFFAKSGGAPSWMIERGATYLLDAATKGPLVPLVLAIIIVPRAFRKFEVLAPSAVALAFVLFTLWVGGDYLPFGRFVVPVIPLLAFAAAAAFDEMANRLSIGAARALACIVCLAGLLAHFGETRVRAFENATQRYAIAAAWLRDHATSEMLVATPAAGIIGWTTKAHVLDEFGLTDAYTARHLDPHLDAAKLRAPAGHERGNADYLLERSPDVVLLANVWVRPIPLTAAALRQNLEITSITDRLLLADRRFFGRFDILNYRLDEGTWLGMAVRKDSVLHPSHPAHAGPLPTPLAADGY